MRRRAGAWVMGAAALANLGIATWSVVDQRYGAIVQQFVIAILCAVMSVLFIHLDTMLNTYKHTIDLLRGQMDKNERLRAANTKLQRKLYDRDASASSIRLIH